MGQWFSGKGARSFCKWLHSWFNIWNFYQLLSRPLEMCELTFHWWGTSVVVMSIYWYINMMEISMIVPSSSTSGLKSICGTDYHHPHHRHRHHHRHHRLDCVNPLVKGSSSPSAALIVSQRRVNPCLSRHLFSLSSPSSSASSTSASSSLAAESSA